MRKIISMVLALMMLALPVMGLAATPEELMMKALTGDRAVEVTVSFEPGKITAEDQVAAAAKDMLEGLSIHTLTAVSGQYSQFQVLMNGKAIFSNEMSLKDGVAGLDNPILGTAVKLAKGDVRSFMTNLAKTTGADPSEVPQLEQVIAQLEGALSSAPLQMPEISLDEAHAAISESIASLFDKGEDVEALDTAGEFSEVAKGKKVTLTAELVKELFASLTKNMNLKDDVLSQVNQGLEAAFTNLKESTATLYYSSDGVPVLLKMDVTSILEKSGSDSELTYGTLQLYVGQTYVDGVAAVRVHTTAQLSENPDGVVHGVLTAVPTEEKTDISGELYLVNEEKTQQVATLEVVKTKAYQEMEASVAYEGTIAYLLDPKDESTKETITFHGDENTTFDGKDAKSVEQLMVSVPALGVEGLKIKVVTSTQDVPVMDMSSAKDLGAMSEEELKTFMNTVTMGAMSYLGNLMQMLPASVTKLFLPTSTSH